MFHRPDACFSGQQYNEEVLPQYGSDSMSLKWGSKARSVRYRKDKTFLSQSRRLPLLQVVSNNKSFSVGVQSPTEINAPRGRTLSGRQWFCADRNEV